MNASEPATSASALWCHAILLYSNVKKTGSQGPLKTAVMLQMITHFIVTLM